MVDIDPESLFGNDDDDDTTLESVGVEDKQDTKNPKVSQEAGNSSADFYSSIASALKNDGVLEYLDQDAIASVTDADTFRDALETEIRNRFDDKQKELLLAVWNVPGKLHSPLPCKAALILRINGDDVFKVRELC